jgi:hypothetical protein
MILSSLGLAEKSRPQLFEIPRCAETSLIPGNSLDASVVPTR